MPEVRTMFLVIHCCIVTICLHWLRCFHDSRLRTFLLVGGLYWEENFAVPQYSTIRRSALSLNFSKYLENILWITKQHKTSVEPFMTLSKDNKIFQLFLVFWLIRVFCSIEERILVYKRNCVDIVVRDMSDSRMNHYIHLKHDEKRHFPRWTCFKIYFCTFCKDFVLIVYIFYDFTLRMKNLICDREVNLRYIHVISFKVIWETLRTIFKMKNHNTVLNEHRILVKFCIFVSIFEIFDVNYIFWFLYMKKENLFFDIF